MIVLGVLLVAAFAAAAVAVAVTSRPAPVPPPRVVTLPEAGLLHRVVVLPEEPGGRGQVVVLPDLRPTSRRRVSAADAWSPAARGPAGGRRPVGSRRRSGVPGPAGARGPAGAGGSAGVHPQSRDR